MQIHCIRSEVSDNWFYLVATDDGRDGLLIDPVDAEAALSAARGAGVRVTKVVNTHWHPDHVAGNDAVLAATSARLYVPAGEASLIAGKGHPLEVKDTISVGDDDGVVLLTPGHTQAHISLRFGQHLFCGDVVFAAGAGNCRFGDPLQLCHTFREVLGPMGGETVFYPGHDYAVRNLEFALHLEPGHAAAAEELERSREDGALRLRTLGQERAYNPFMRMAEPALQDRLRTVHSDAWDAAAGRTDAERAFVATRALRNHW
jgi:hydroxyacylglutathione hydrolase